MQTVQFTSPYRQVLEAMPPILMGREYGVSGELHLYRVGMNWTLTINAEKKRPLGFWKDVARRFKVDLARGADDDASVETSETSEEAESAQQHPGSAETPGVEPAKAPHVRKQGRQAPAKAVSRRRVRTVR